MIDEAKLAKLPVWARTEIERLTRDVKSWREEALAASGGDGRRTDTVVWDGLGEERGLPPGTIIRFYMAPKAPGGERRYLEARVEYDHGATKGKGEATGITVRGWRPINVKPGASNLITIEPEEDT